MRALECILHAEWWSRIWVVQETVLATNAAVLRGSLTISWSRLSKAAENLITHRFSCCAALVEALPPTHTKALIDFSLIMDDFKEARAYQSMQQGNPLLPLMQHFRSRGASDDRDKVYALLGLAHTFGMKIGLTPDYTLTTAEVYTRTVIKMVEASNSLTILLGNQEKNRHPELPSWVPDLTSWSGYDELERVRRMSRYLTSAGKRPNLTILSGSILSSSGIQFDEVSAIAGIMLYLPGKIGHSILDS